MNNFRNLNWQIIFIVGIFLIFIIGIIFRVLTPEQTSIPQTDFVTTNQDGKKSNFSNIVFDGNYPQISTKLSIYSFGKQTGSVQEILNSLIKNNNLKPNTNLNDFWQNDQGFTLYKETYKDEYVFLLPPSTKKNQELTSDELVNLASNFVKKNIPNEPLTPFTKDLKELPSDPEALYQPNQVKSELFSIPFTYSLDGYPIFYQKESKYPFYVNIGIDGQIKSLKFPTDLISFNKISENNTLTIEQALLNINQNQAAITSSYTEVEQVLDLSQIESAKLDQVEIQYRFDESTALLYPFYKFSGVATNHQSEKIFIEIITPAVLTSNI